MISTETVIPFSATGSDMATLSLQHALWDTALLQETQIGIAHDGNGVWLAFDVWDKFLQSKKRSFNDDVHLDNCVEFFFRFPGDINYYNFEFNCLGSIKAAYGPGRNQRKFLPVAMLQRITQSLQISISNQNKKGLFNWKINVYIPLKVFSFNSISSLQNVTCEANFTQCGDMLPQPHYFSWVYIETSTPDFHRPEFFGHIHFS